MAILFRVLILVVLILPGFKTYASQPSDTLKHPSISGDELYIIKSIAFVGNKRTRVPLLNRELAVKIDTAYVGTDLLSALELSVRNLNNTQLFNSVNFDLNVNDHTIDLTFKFVERWYIWPSPIFDINERNFNEWWKDKDISRVSYGLFVQVNNFRGRNETLNSGFKYGFDQALLLQHVIPYLDENYRNGLAFTLTYRRNHEMAYALENNELIYFKDNDKFLKRQLDISLKFSRRVGFYEHHILELEAHDQYVSDTILKLNPQYHSNSSGNQQYLALSYFYSDDHRDDKNYPLEGYYTDFKIQKDGIFNNDVDHFNISSSIRYYKPLGKKFFIASGIRGRVGSKLVNPFSQTRFLGFSNSFVRGYEPYVIAANDYILNRNNIRFNILPKKVVHLGFIPFKQFNDIPNTLYLNLHADMGWARDFYIPNSNGFNQEFMLGGGLGLDYVTYYSLVMRFEYSINRLGERGFFINFTAPI